MSEIRYEIVSPKKLENAATAHMVIVPGSEGDIAFMLSRMPMMLMLKAGVVYIMDAQRKVTARIFITGGYAWFEEDTLRILCNESYDLDTISQEAINEKQKAAQEKYKAAHTEIEQDIEQSLLQQYELMSKLKSASAY